MHKDDLNELRRCEAYQLHAPFRNTPKYDLVTISTAWSFHKWGMDIVGPFPASTGGVNFLFVAVVNLQKCRKKQFEFDPFIACCTELHIRQMLTSVAHPQANEQVERINRSIVEGLKARLEIMENTGWKNCQAYCGQFAQWEKPVMAKTPNDHARVREAQYKQHLEKYYNTQVKPETFKPGDLVLRKNKASQEEDTGKMRPKWEGPYQITQTYHRGSYKLSDMEGKPIPRHWNVANLRRFYV
ncbi:hypothetical protein E3N88_29672 [Mikania micrantha]|uniref:Integrase catalytic domain-containing protein n=1 Tax=Mikania micrantha TaxID=192012 RepID=A0A5N6MKF3_9ASTR|nr:hypothetical protein E3N88_29672 [Mikania micrantha]